MTSLPAPTAERPQLTVAEIISTAMLLLEHSDVDRLTIRALAKQLGVAPGAVYYYVESKEDLLHQIGQAIIEAAPIPPPGPWRQRLRSRIKGTVATFARFPGSDALAGSAEPWRRPEGQQTPMAEILGEAGVAPSDIEQAEFVVTLFTAGALRLAEIQRREGVDPPFAQSADLDAAIDTLIAGLVAQHKLA
jgi:AcrR family transcriptional regulator